MRPSYVQRFIDAFEALTPADLGTLEACFAEDARFVDPFNDVRGRPAIRAVFAHMFANCEDPRFLVDECVGDASPFYIHWQFRFGLPPRRRRITGVSRIEFTSDGLVSEHHDYWDPASQLYEDLPAIGHLFRALRRRLAAPAAEPTQKPPARPAAA